MSSHGDAPTQRAEALIAICDELAAFARRETALLAQRKPPLGEAEQARKGELATRYRLEMARLGEDPRPILDCPKPVLDRLKASVGAMRSACEEHRDALDAVKAISEGLMQALAEETARQAALTAPYAASGAVQGPAATAIAVNKKA